ncbi:hypothetical protein [Xanthobacter sediminis]
MKISNRDDVIARRRHPGLVPATPLPFRPHDEAHPAAASAMGSDLSPWGLRPASAAGVLALPAHPAAARGRLLATLLLGAAWFILPAQARAQQSCGYGGDGSFDCTVPAGSYSTPIAISESTLNYVPMTVTSAGNVSVADAVSLPQPNSLYGLGVSLTSSASSYWSTDGLSITNSGSLAVTPTSDTQLAFSLFGIRAEQWAINGGSTDTPLSITNSGAITLNLPGTQVINGAGIWAMDLGGGVGFPDTGGNSSGVTINNSGAITINLAGQQSFAGIEATSQGGGAGNDNDEDGGSAGAGGNAGTVSVTNSAPVAVTYTLQNVSAPAGLYGIVSESVGAAGGISYDGNGGAGGAGGAASVTLTAGGDVAVTLAPGSAALDPSFNGGGVVVIATGGTGGTTSNEESADGGSGGSAGTATIQVTDADVTTSGNGLPALLLVQQGGTGGYAGCQSSTTDCDFYNTNAYQNGGDGGAAGSSGSVSGIAVTASAGPVTLSTAGDNSAAIQAQLTGGTGGGGGSNSSDLVDHAAGNGGNGGSVNNNLQVTLTGSTSTPISIQTQGDNSAGILALGTGGTGATGGDYSGTILSSNLGGTGGNGGNGGNITIGISGTQITTQGVSSAGIFAQSTGGPGGNGGSDSESGSSNGGPGGGGGAGGAVIIQTDSASQITTQGESSSGIVALSVAGAGGAGGNASGAAAYGGNGGPGGNSGNVSVTNAGGITTAGDTSRGILAQSIAGTGGTGGGGSGFFFAGGGSGASAGTVGAVSVTNSGLVTTTGANAQGVLIQSIGGAGGAGGSAGGGIFGDVGGNASNVGGSTDNSPFTVNGGAVTYISNSGGISTTGISSAGVLGQSIGGGGGDGGGAYQEGIGVAIGGNGGGGGAGGAVLAQLTGTDAAPTQIVTTGDNSPGLLLQSIGGGGGNAGNASSTGLFIAVGIGGTGGVAGDGGTVTVQASSTNIVTSGTKSTGILAQSIGGGGGTGGSAFATSVGAVFSASVAVGGAGAAGGNGNAVSVSVADSLIATGQNPLLINGSGGTTTGGCTALPCNTLPVDSYGVLLQSIGGGGGAGGSATATAIALQVPVTESGSQVGIAISAAVGGSGGSGGDGGTAQFSLSNGGWITTAGQGSTAVLAQSIGGGGGTGGDSSALSGVISFINPPDDAESLNVTVTFTMGGNGGSGGDGQQVQVGLGGTFAADGSFTQDPAGSAKSAIVTYGDYADGVSAQSIGGGGGNAGFGSGNTQSFGTGTSVSVSVGLGSSGGTGGVGGEVDVYHYAEGGITTYGSGALGILAQSVGGGGGTSQGGSVSASVGIENPTGDEKQGVNIGFGTQGGSGNTGGNVNVVSAAPISTHGGDATGILAQSVGGGGGLGGSAGADASADAPWVAALAAREGQSAVNDLLKNGKAPQITETLALSFGGAGGTGADGGTVTVDLSSTITTLGDWANGIVAQSIGGGGGKGGTAAASGTGGLPEITLNLDYALGGSGGTGGQGGTVLVTLDQGNTAVSTAGYGASGIVAQSIGGGGGMAADGSDSATGLISVGGSSGGTGGTGGAGGSVTLNYANATPATVTTAGDAADGIVLQSVGGGGGIAGAGSSLYVSAFRMQGQTMTLTAGGGTGDGGNGGAVLLEQAASQTASGINIATSGNSAFGLLAQSIGGSGGLVTAQPSTSAVVTNLGAGSTGDGGTVTLDATNVAIATQGIAAHGIVAQSIGGGGGLIRVADDSANTPSVTTAWNSANGSLTSGSGAGGAVSIYLINGSVAVTGAGAIGILAQSIGGGGGVVINDNSIFAGSAAASGGTSFGGGNVLVQASGNVSATGENGIGIFAQSQGSGANGAISVSVHDTVTGGSGTAATATLSGAAGVWIDGGNTANEVTVHPGATLTTALGSDGTAVLQTGNSATNVWNYGTLTGATYLNGGSVATSSSVAGAAGAVSGGALHNFGTYNAGAVVDGSLTNAGVVRLGEPGLTHDTHVTGDFTQTRAGELRVAVDSLNSKASHLQVDGTATLDGVIVPMAVALLPGTFQVLSAGGLASTADARDSLLYRWNATQSGNSLSLTPTASFRPAGVALTSSQASFADHMARAWANADAGLASHFGELSQISSGGGYTAALDEYSSKDVFAPALALINSAGDILGSAMSCPVFIDSGVLLGEDSCTWLQVSGSWTSQDGTANIQGYNVSGVNYRIGAQRQVAPDWYLGGSFAFGQSWATMEGGSSGSGDTYDGSVSLKHTLGPWYFAGSLALAYGTYDVSRQVNLPGSVLPLDSSPSVLLGGGRLRAGYEFTFNDWYIRPYGDVDLIFTHMPGVQETAFSPYALNIRESNQTAVAFSFMTEVGGRMDLEGGMILKPYAAFGVSYMPDNTLTVDASFVRATTDNGTFADDLETPQFLARLQLGLQLYQTNGFELRGGYSADIGDTYTSQSARARFLYHF